MKNWRTTIFGVIGGTAGTSALAALADPAIKDILAQAGMSPLLLAIIAGCAKVIRDCLAKDAKVSGATTPEVPAAP